MIAVYWDLDSAGARTAAFFRTSEDFFRTSEDEAKTEEGAFRLLRG
jgi:hypothetical protein